MSGGWRGAVCGVVAVAAAAALLRCRTAAPPRTDGAVDTAAHASTRLLDDPAAWTIESKWSPRAEAVAERELTPSFRADFEAGLPAGMTAFALPASFPGTPPLRAGTVLPPEPAPALVAEAAAEGTKGLRFAHAAGAAFVVVPVTPDTPYLLACDVRRAVDPAAAAPDDDTPAGRARRARLALTAQVGSMLVLELNQLPPAGISPAGLLAALDAKSNTVVTSHAVAADGPVGVFGESRLLCKTSVFTNALVIGLVGGNPGWWALPDSARDGAAPPEGAVDFDALRLFELSARDYLPVQHLSVEDDLPPASTGDPRVRKVKLLGDVRRALLAPPATRASVALRLPAGRFRLAFSYGVVEERRATYGRTPITFVVTLERPGRAPRTLLRTPLRASETAAARAWQEFRMEEDGDGGAATLVLESSAPAECGDVAVFGEPSLVALHGAAELPRNVVLISVDTLRSDRLGCYGYARADGQRTTPALDAFAAESLRFAQARSVAPYTLPAHATLFTGLYPRVHGVTRTGRRLVEGLHPLLAVDFARAGYATAAFTGGAFLSYEHGFHAGFDRYSILDPFLTDEDPYRTAFPRPGDRAFNDAAYATCDRAAIGRWLDGQAGRPFFLFVHTYVAHNYHPPKPVERRFLRGDAALLGPARDLKQIDRAVADAGIPVPPEVAAVASDLYDGAVAAADAAVGGLLDDLRARGLLERTVVAIVSDHGEEFAEHGGLLHGRTVYEEMLRVPLLLRVPGVAPSVVDAPVDQCDVAPTLRAAAGLASAPLCDGVDLLARIERDEFQEAFWAEVSAPGLSRRRALVAAGRKLIENPLLHYEEREYAKRAPPAWEWYALPEDPREQHDRVRRGAAPQLEPLDDHEQEPAFVGMRRAAEARRSELDRERLRLLPDRAAIEFHGGGQTAQLRALAYVVGTDEDGADD